MASGELLAVVLSLTTLLGGVVVILGGLRYRAHIKELRHRERLAMIERGLVPPPAVEADEIGRGPRQRSLSFGIIVVGLGLGLMLLISVAAGAPDIGIGVGGAVAILGGAFIVRSMFAAPTVSAQWPHHPPPFPPVTAPAAPPVAPPVVPPPTEPPAP